MKTKAIIRDPNLYVSTHNASKIKLDKSPLSCWEPDELDDSEYNLVILHGDALYRVPSIDFDFINEK